MGTALAMAIIMNVSAFADAGDSAEDPITGAYDDVNNAVLVSAIKDALPEMTSGQYTVVVIPVLGEDEVITDSNIHYINQADGADAIWADSAKWGTPDALADGMYIVRVGDEAGNVSETYFRVGEEQSAGPKVTFMNGTTTFATVDTVGGKATLPTEVPTLAKVDGYATSTYTFVEWVTVAEVDGKEVLTPFTADTVVEADTTVYPKFKSNFVYGDVTGEGTVNTTDRGYLHMYIKSNGVNVRGQTAKPISALLENTVVGGDVTGEGTVNTTDRGYLHMYIKSNGVNVRGQTTKPYYVVNR